jgi:hypothetical protein
MSLRYTSTNRVVESIKEIAEAVDVGDDEVKLSVYDCDATFCNASLDGLRDRNLTDYIGREVCSFTYDGTRLTLSFHERHVDGTFELTPAGPDAVDPRQASNPAELAPALEDMLFELSHELDAIAYDFVELSAGSMANGGHFTDFEFTYVVTTTKV